MNNLTEIARKYNVDKDALGYLKHYESKFDSIRNDVDKVLEIGLDTGGSHLMWLDYFPNANVYAMDNRIVYEDKVYDKRTGRDMVMVNGWNDRDKERSFIFRGDQSNVEDDIFQTTSFYVTLVNLMIILTRYFLSVVFCTKIHCNALQLGIRIQEIPYVRIFQVNCQ